MVFEWHLELCKLGIPHDASSCHLCMSSEDLPLCFSSAPDVVCRCSLFGLVQQAGLAAHDHLTAANAPCELAAAKYLVCCRCATYRTDRWQGWQLKCVAWAQKQQRRSCIGNSSGLGSCRATRRPRWVQLAAGFWGAGRASQEPTLQLVL